MLMTPAVGRPAVAVVGPRRGPGWKRSRSTRRPSIRSTRSRPPSTGISSPTGGHPAEPGHDEPADRLVVRVVGHLEPDPLAAARPVATARARPRCRRAAGARPAGPGRARRRPRRPAPRRRPRGSRHPTCRRTRRPRRPAAGPARAAGRAAGRGGWSPVRRGRRPSGRAAGTSSRRSKGTETARLTWTTPTTSSRSSSIDREAGVPGLRAQLDDPGRAVLALDRRAAHPRGHHVGRRQLGEAQRAGDQLGRARVEGAGLGRPPHHRGQLLRRAGAGQLLLRLDPEPRAGPGWRCR